MTIDLSLDEIRAVTHYAVDCARPALALNADPRLPPALDIAQAFADGGRRVKALRDHAWITLEAARETTQEAGQAARAVSAACGAAFLHPLARATQVKHVLGSAAHTARAFELSGAIPDDHLDRAHDLASPLVVDVLSRYPPAPAGGGRVGELVRRLDTRLRGEISA